MKKTKQKKHFSSLYQHQHQISFNQKDIHRQQIIPNRILLSDHSTLTPYRPYKQKKVPFFVLKNSPKKAPQTGNMFTNRGIIFSSGELHERQEIKLSFRGQRKQTESSLSLFNKLILTPFNFVRPNSHFHHLSTSVLKTKQKPTIRLSLPRQKLRSAQRSSLKPSPSRMRTLQEWSRGQERGAFSGWQTSPLEGEEVFC